MQIKTADGNASVSSAGVGGTALGIGIGALGLAVLQGANNGNGLLGGLFGGNNNTTNAEIALASEKSARYTDQVNFQSYKESVAAHEAINARICNLEKEQALTDCAVKCLQNKVDGITATYVPATQVTPLPMPFFNAWATPPFPFPPAPTVNSGTSTDTATTNG